MSVLLTIVYLLMIVHVHGSTILLYDDIAYNPCQIGSNVFFYPHPSDSHKYYQCDESGNPYLQSCGKLVWDQVALTCNLSPAVVYPPVSVVSTSTTTSSILTTSSSSVVTKQQQSTTTSSQFFSLCKPINPCGQHGQCVEPPITVLSGARRFACMCLDDWFGILCDKRIDDLTTPPTLNFDKTNPDESQTINAFSLPILTEKGTKSIFYGLKDNVKTEKFHRLQKRTISIGKKTHYHI